MGLTFHKRYVYVGSHHRFWLLATATLAFLLAVLWASPTG